MNKENNKNIGHSLGALISKYGVPLHLIYDGAAVQVGSNNIFQNHVRKHEIQTQKSAPQRLNENPSEGSIREIKINWYQIQENNNIPKRMWEYGIDYFCETAHLTVNNSR